MDSVIVVFILHELGTLQWCENSEEKYVGSQNQAHSGLKELKSELENTEDELQKKHNSSNN